MKRLADENLFHYEKSFPIFTNAFIWFEKRRKWVTRLSLNLKQPGLYPNRCWLRKTSVPFTLKIIVKKSRAVRIWWKFWGRTMKIRNGEFWIKMKFWNHSQRQWISLTQKSLYDSTTITSVRGSCFTRTKTNHLFVCVKVDQLKQIYVQNLLAVNGIFGI